LRSCDGELSLMPGSLLDLAAVTGGLLLLRLTDSTADEILSATEAEKTLSKDPNKPLSTKSPEQVTKENLVAWWKEVCFI